jgi:uncharacterized protein
MALVERHATSRVADLLRIFRLVVVGGARQVGKTTLVRDLLGSPVTTRISFDEPAVLRSALADPVGFIEGLPRPAVVDEYQRAGEGFLLAVKLLADRHRERGQLLLTGSASYLASRTSTETLAGRAGRIELWPLSGGERRGVRETFVDALFDLEAWPPPALDTPSRAELVDWMLEGGYPEIVTEGIQGRDRDSWFSTYVNDVVSREALRPLADVRLEAELRQVLRLLCARTAHELVISDLAADAELSRATVSDYVTMLEALYLIRLVPAWSTSATTRAKRRSKVIVRDSGLAASVAGLGKGDFLSTADGRHAGALFESTVIAEVAKQSTWSERSVDISHYRDRDGREIDLVLDDRQTGQVAGVEIKLTASPTDRHARHLAWMRDRLGDRFRLGLVVHAGQHALPLGERLWAVPVGALWRSDR